MSRPTFGTFLFGTFLSLSAATAWAQPAGQVDAPPVEPVPQPAQAQPAQPVVATPPQPSPEALLSEARVTATLELMRQKGLISQKEYDDAMQGHQPPPRNPDEPPPQAVTDKWGVNLYGFVELDTIWDSTESFNELSGNTLIARPGTFAGEHSRTLFTMRNSRLGFKFRTPEFHRISAVATMEFDLLGNQPPGASEIQTFVNDTFRIRHANVELQTPWFNLLFGQSWELFGWQSYFHPATAAIQGVPGQIYSRAPQIRLTHIVKTAPVNIELAAAAVRSPQRDSSNPDGQAGIRLFINKWKGVHSVGSAGTSVDPAAIGVSGTIRQFSLASPTVKPPDDVSTLSTLGWGVSIDAVLPVIPATVRKAWALTVSGSFVRGTGIADLYTGLNGGVAFPTSPVLPMGWGPTNIDNGLALYSRDGVLETVSWQSLMVGGQLYLPPSGKVWISSYFSQMDCDNCTDFLVANASKPGTNTNNVITRSRWADVNLFWDLTPAVRLAAEYSWFWQVYDDSVEAKNHRFQFSAFYIF